MTVQLKYLSFKKHSFVDLKIKIFSQISTPHHFNFTFYHMSDILFESTWMQVVISFFLLKK